MMVNIILMKKIDTKDIIIFYSSILLYLKMSNALNDGNFVSWSADDFTNNE